MKSLSECGIIAAVRNSEEFDVALKSKVKIIFDLSPDLLTLTKRAESVHKSGKKLFIHIDLATGIGKDKSGILYAKSMGVDGIISTRVNIIKIARELELFTVQRFFIVDSHSIDTTIEAIKASKADMIEVMPGVVIKTIKKLKEKLNIPIIAGGLVEDIEEVEEALKNGAVSVSTGKKELWKLV